MIWFKGCPRCKGDLVQGNDQYGLYVVCLQCGHDLADAEERALYISGSLARSPQRLLREATRELVRAA